MNFRIHFYRACSSMRTMGVVCLRERKQILWNRKMI